MVVIQHLGATSPGNWNYSSASFPPNFLASCVGDIVKMWGEMKLCAQDLNILPLILSGLCLFPRIDLLELRRAAGCLR